MTKTELLALAERLTTHGRADDLNALALDTKRLRHSEREAIEAAQTVAMQAAAILRKLAALEPAVFTSQSWMNEPNGFPRVVSHTKRAGFDKPLHDLTGIIDHE